MNDIIRTVDRGEFCALVLLDKCSFRYDRPRHSIRRPWEKIRNVPWCPGIRVGDLEVKPVESVWDLGVTLDCQLNMRAHISKTVSACYYHLRRIRQLRHSLDKDDRQRLVSARVLIIIIIIIHSFRRAQCQTSELLRTVIRIWGARVAGS